MCRGRAGALPLGAEGTRAPCPLVAAAGQGHAAVLRLFMARVDYPFVDTVAGGMPLTPDGVGPSLFKARTAVLFALLNAHHGDVHDEARPSMDRILLIASQGQPTAHLATWIDGAGRSPLFAAAEGQHVAALEELLVHAARELPLLVNCRSSTGATVLHAIARCGSEPLLETLRAALAPVPATWRELLDVVDVQQGTALTAAAATGHLAMVMALLRHDASLDVLHRSPQQPSALLAAAKAGHDDIVRALVRHVVEYPQALQIDVDARVAAPVRARERRERIATWLNLPDHRGWTALMYAAGHGLKQSVRLLLQHGANVNARGHGLGASALMLAAMHGRVTVLPLLIEAGADLHATIQGSKTALDLARQAKRRRAAAVLEEALAATANHVNGRAEAAPPTASPVLPSMPAPLSRSGSSSRSGDDLLGLGSLVGSLVDGVWSVAAAEQPAEQAGLPSPPSQSPSLGRKPLLLGRKGSASALLPPLPPVVPLSGSAEASAPIPVPKRRSSQPTGGHTSGKTPPSAGGRRASAQAAMGSPNSGRRGSSATTSASSTLSSAASLTGGALPVDVERDRRYETVGLIRYNRSQRLGTGSQGTMVYQGFYGTQPAAIKRMHRVHHGSSGSDPIADKEIHVLIALAEQAATLSSDEASALILADMTAMRSSHDHAAPAAAAPVSAAPAGNTAATGADAWTDPPIVCYAAASAPPPPSPCTVRLAPPTLGAAGGWSTGSSAVSSPLPTPPAQGQPSPLLLPSPMPEQELRALIAQGRHNIVRYYGKVRARAQTPSFSAGVSRSLELTAPYRDRRWCTSLRSTSCGRRKTTSTFSWRWSSALARCSRSSRAAARRPMCLRGCMPTPRACPRPRRAAPPTAWPLSRRPASTPWWRTRRPWSWCASRRRHSRSASCAPCSRAWRTCTPCTSCTTT